MTDVPYDIPLQGLRRHALALTVGLLLLVGLFILPDLSPPPEPTLPEVELVQARLLTIEPPGTDPTQPDATVFGDGSGRSVAPGWD